MVTRRVSEESYFYPTRQRGTLFLSDASARNPISIRRVSEES
jgi:hypothetical protein